MKVKLRKLAIVAICTVLVLGNIFQFFYNGNSLNESKPKYVFLFIGDGMGNVQKQCAEYYKKHIENDNTACLAMNTLPITGSVTTYCSDSLITDSAAAATALATGHKTNRNYVGVGIDGKTEYKTIIEAANDAGLATGIITSDSLTGATPAAFASHVKDRSMKMEIAEQLCRQNINYLAGTGYKYFVSKEEGGSRQDGKNLIEEFISSGYSYVDSKEKLSKIEADTNDKVIALFEDASSVLDGMPFAIDKNEEYPTQKEILEKGIEILMNDQDGFLLVCENEGIDMSGHCNDVASVVHEVLDFDQTIQCALEFYEKHADETLILITSDHETGGLALGSSGEVKLNLDVLDGVKGSYTDGLILPIFTNIVAGEVDIQSAVNEIDEYENFNMTQAEKDQMSTEIECIIDGFIVSGDFEKAGYSMYELLGEKMCDKTNIAWSSVEHTAAPVEISAVGVSAELFSGHLDNTQIAEKIAMLLNLSLE